MTHDLNDDETMTHDNKKIAFDHDL